MKELDFNDEKTLEEFAKETVRLTEEYQNYRATYGESLKNLKIALAKAYKEGIVKETISEDKAFIILSNQSEELKQDLENVVVDEQNYKGLEAVITARQALVTLYQSLVKNRPR